MQELVPLEVVARLSLSVQPLVYETGVDDYPYSSSGTVFLVWYEGKAYVLTTRHGLHPENPPPICVFPSDASQRLMPLRNVFFVPRADEPEDFMDLAVIEVDPSAFSDPELRQATLLDLALACEREWVDSASSMTFFVVGYPEERSRVDDQAQELETERITLFGRYAGESSLPFLHLVQTENHLGLASFVGFSGGPVFAWRSDGQLQAKPMLCGMAIRGTASSGLIHFLDVSVLLDALAVKRSKHEQSDVELILQGGALPQPSPASETD